MTKYIPEDIIAAFLESYQQGNIWQVNQLNDRWLIVFLYHDKQIETERNLPIYRKMKEEYFQLVKQYLNPLMTSADDISIQFDSKEHFEKKYQGNWYDYYH